MLSIGPASISGEESYGRVFNLARMHSLSLSKGQKGANQYCGDQNRSLRPFRAGRQLLGCRLLTGHSVAKILNSFQMRRLRGPQ
jgi:hypothetical protein